MNPENNVRGTKVVKLNLDEVEKSKLNTQRNENEVQRDSKDTIKASFNVINKNSRSSRNTHDNQSSVYNTNP